MRKYLLLVASILAAPFINSKSNTAESQIDKTIELAKKATDNKSTIEIKPINKMMLAPQDIVKPGGDDEDSMNHKGLV